MSEIIQSTLFGNLDWNEVHINYFKVSGIILKNAKKDNTMLKIN